MLSAAHQGLSDNRCSNTKKRKAISGLLYTSRNWSKKQFVDIGNIRSFLYNCILVNVAIRTGTWHQNTDCLQPIYFFMYSAADTNDKLLHTWINYMVAKPLTTAVTSCHLIMIRNTSYESSVYILQQNLASGRMIRTGDIPGNQEWKNFTSSYISIRHTKRPK